MSVTDVCGTFMNIKYVDQLNRQNSKLVVFKEVIYKEIKDVGVNI